MNLVIVMALKIIQDFLIDDQPGTRPFCLLDYFPKDFLCVIDESHQTIPQVSGMYGGDRSRKLILVEYGFRLPSALIIVH